MSLIAGSAAYLAATGFLASVILRDQKEAEKQNKKNDQHRQKELKNRYQRRTKRDASIYRPI